MVVRVVKSRLRIHAGVIQENIVCQVYNDKQCKFSKKNRKLGDLKIDYSKSTV